MADPTPPACSAAWCQRPRPAAASATGWSASTEKRLAVGLLNLAKPDTPRRQPTQHRANQQSKPQPPRAVQGADQPHEHPADNQPQHCDRDPAPQRRPQRRPGATHSNGRHPRIGMTNPLSSPPEDLSADLTVQPPPGLDRLAPTRNVDGCHSARPPRLSASTAAADWQPI